MEMMIKVNAIAPGTVIRIEYAASRPCWPYTAAILVNGEPVASVAANEIKLYERDKRCSVGQCYMVLLDETDVAVVQEFIKDTN